MGCCNTADATEPQPDNDAVTEALRKKSKLKEPSLLRSEMNASHAQTQMREKEVFAPQVSEQELVEDSIRFKELGNVYFKEKKYALALEEYTEAIKIYNKDSIYFSNRAICYRLLKNYNLAIQDCETAIELNELNYKAYNTRGIACIERARTERDIRNKREDMDMGILSLQEAKKVHEKEHKNDESTSLAIIKEIDQSIDKAKFLKWTLEQDIQTEKIEQADKFLRELLNKPQDEELILEIQESFLHADYLSSNQHQNDLKIPQMYQCPISFELMQFPILVSSGLTYEQSSINAHFAKKNLTDPLTREPLEPKCLIPNVPLSAAITEFKENNPWFYREEENLEDAEDIKF